MFLWFPGVIDFFFFLWRQICQVSRVWLQVYEGEKPKPLISPVMLLHQTNGNTVLEAMVRSLGMRCKSVMVQYGKFDHIFLTVVHDFSEPNRRGVRLMRRELRRLGLKATVAEKACDCHVINKISAWVLGTLSIISPLFCCVNLMRMGSFKTKLHGDFMVLMRTRLVWVYTNDDPANLVEAKRYVLNMSWAKQKKVQHASNTGKVNVKDIHADIDRQVEAGEWGGANKNMNREFTSCITLYHMFKDSS